MSILTPLTSLPPHTSPPPSRMTVDEYHQLIQNGMLTENDPVELLEGLVVSKMPHNPPHDSTVDLAHELLQARLPAGWRIRIQSAITTGDSEPEPDLAVVPGTAQRYAARHPGPTEIALVVEVADTTLSRDRTDKARLYARAGIVCYWIINLTERQVEVYTDPTGPVEKPAYQQRHDYRPGDDVPLSVGGQAVDAVAVADLLP